MTSTPAEKWFAQIDESRFRDAGNDQPAPMRSHPDPYDEPFDLGVYAGPHGYVYVSPTIAVCQCGWHPWNHPNSTVADHLKDWNEAPVSFGEQEQ
ncbi:hypothetical protein AB0P17_29645 [Streptomyces sp. NPDC088124]|uniref:hypothetical protein n=1 Tax=Streptomyces sp. NPDC088124 TaxID=3154654 RepID=UPI003440A9DC